MIDVCGQSCPIPVIMTQKEIKKKEKLIEILADNECAVENIKRLAYNNGYTFEVKNDGDEYRLTLTLK